MSDGFLAVTNWRRYQSYPEAIEPRWVKLAVHVLDDKKVNALPPLAQVLWFKLLPMAARYGNAIPRNVSSIASEARLERHTVAKSLTKLLEVGLIRETKTSRRVYENGRKSPAEIMEIFIQNVGHLFSEKALLAEMRERGVPDDERARLIELARNLA